MEKRLQKRKRLGQNFLRDKKLARRLVNLSSIGKDDVIYEIGPGRGVITAELARIAKRVVAIEIDPELVRHLRARFRTSTNVNIVECDFLRFRSREKRFKVFANLPFGITAEAMKRLLYQLPGIDEIFVVLQREAALKYTGGRSESVRSLSAKTRFSLDIVYRLRPGDFVPQPDVNAVLMKISRRERESVPSHMNADWHRFIRRGFCSWRRNARIALKDIFSYKQWKHLSRELGFKLDAKPSELTFEQWLGLFWSFKKISTEN